MSKNKRKKRKTDGKVQKREGKKDELEQEEQVQRKKGAREEEEKGKCMEEK